MSTHPIEPTPRESAKLVAARVNLIERITEAKPEPVHESAIYVFGPYADWLEALDAERSGTGTFWMRQAAEILAGRIAIRKDRHQLAELARYVVALATSEDL